MREAVAFTRLLIRTLPVIRLAWMSCVQNPNLKLNYKNAFELN